MRQSRLLTRFLLPCLLLFSTSSLLAKDPVYRVAMVPWIGWSPFHVADVHDYWKDYGIDVEIVMFESSIDMNEAFLNDRVDFTMELIGTAVGWHQFGTEIRVLAETDWSNGGDKLIIKEGERLEKLKGYPIGTYLDTPAITYFLQLYLKSQNLTLSDFELVRMDSEQLQDNFIDGRLRLMVNYDPHTIRAVKEGNGTVLVNSSRFAGCMPQGIIVKQSRLDEIPEKDLVNFFRGYLRAVAWMQDSSNEGAFRQMVNEKVFVRDDDFSVTEIRAMRTLGPTHDAAKLRVRNRPNGGVQQFLGKLRSFMKDEKQLRKDFDPEEIAATSYLMKALDK